MIKLKSDNEFFFAREKGLGYYLNYIYNHETLANTTCSKKFLNDTEFDNEYFDLEEIVFEFKCYDQYTNSIKNQVSSIFPNFFKKENKVKMDNEMIEEEKNIEQMTNFLIKSRDMIEELTKLFNSMIKNLNNFTINYDDLAMNFFYLKDVENQNFSYNKDLLCKYNVSLKECSKINKNYSLLLENNINYNLNNILSIIKGILEHLIIWKNFNSKYIIIHSQRETFNGKKAYEEIYEEYRKATVIRENFINIFFKEVKEFYEKHRTMCNDIVQEFKNMFMYLNLHEKNQIINLE